MFEIFQYDFIVRALIVGIVLSITAPCVGTFLVVRRYSALADTLAHVSLVGVAVGLLTQTQPLIASLIITVISAIGIEYMRSNKYLFAESILTLFLSGGLGVATLLISLAKGFNSNLFSFLFGSIATVTYQDVYMTIGIGVAVIVTTYLMYKELFLISLDEDLARASGLPARPLNFILMILAAITIALSLRIVGTLLMGSLMIIPVMSALQFRRGFKKTLIFSVIFSVIAVLLGLAASYYLDIASGSAVVVISLVIFILSSVLTSFRRE